MEEQGQAHRLEEEGTTRKEFVDEDILDTALDSGLSSAQNVGLKVSKVKYDLLSTYTLH